MVKKKSIVEGIIVVAREENEVLFNPMVLSSVKKTESQHDTNTKEAFSENIYTFTTIVLLYLFSVVIF